MDLGRCKMERGRQIDITSVGIRAVLKQKVDYGFVSMVRSHGKGDLFRKLAEFNVFKCKSLNGQNTFYCEFELGSLSIGIDESADADESQRRTFVLPITESDTTLRLRNMLRMCCSGYMSGEEYCAFIVGRLSGICCRIWENFVIVHPSKLVSVVAFALATAGAVVESFRRNILAGYPSRCTLGTLSSVPEPTGT